ncbi:hypothetical protein [Vampirovibrio chlorellavorus]|uniref:hypothetical protein n=1 Tax=Vampirovibrio chlorellavorus TaxID=758823 RepID=UPI0026F2DFB2|nr:hypothetical protein [Vampirovibrio chlorellavorus]
MTTPVQPPKHPQPTCEQAQDLIFSLQEGEPVSDSARTGLSDHLAQCAVCQAYQNDLRQLTATMSDLEPVAVPVGLADRILAQIAETETTAAPATPLSSQRLRWQKFTPVAAAVLILAIAVPLLMPNRPEALIDPTASTLQADAQSATDLGTSVPRESVSSQDGHSASIEGTQLAQGGGALKIGLKQTYASETENDMYYDPVSTLVGF